MSSSSFSILPSLCLVVLHSLIVLLVFLALFQFIPLWMFLKELDIQLNVYFIPHGILILLAILSYFKIYFNDTYSHN